MMKHNFLFLLLFNIALSLFADGAFLGIRIENLSEKDLIANSVKNGVRIIEIIPDSPAKKSNIEVNDILLEINKVLVTSSEDVSRILSQSSPGDLMTLSILRQPNNKINVSVYLADRKIFNEKLFPSDIIRKQSIGVKIETVNPQLAKFLGVKFGVFVLEVYDDSNAKKSGILAGDVILSLEDKNIYSKNDFFKVINQFNDNEDVKIKIFRNGKIIIKSVKTEFINVPYQIYFDEDFDTNEISKMDNSSSSSKQLSIEYLEEKIKYLENEIEKLKER